MFTYPLSVELERRVLLLLCERYFLIAVTDMANIEHLRLSKH